VRLDQEFVVLAAGFTRLLLRLMGRGGRWKVPWRRSGSFLLASSRNRRLIARSEANRERCPST